MEVRLFLWVQYGTLCTSLKGSQMTNNMNTKQGSALSNAIEQLSHCTAEKITSVQTLAELQILLSLSDTSIDTLNIWPDKNRDSSVIGVFLLILLTSDSNNKLTVFHKKLIRGIVSADDFLYAQRAMDLLMHCLVRDDDWQGIQPPLLHVKD